MKDMIQIKARRFNTNGKILHATAEAFERLFAKQTTDLLRLSLHLTADAEKAETCLTLAMRDCLFRSSVSTDRVHIWARWMVIRNAVGLIWGTQSDRVVDSAIELQLQANNYPLEALRESVAILTLPDLDRLTFVICVLERYSILDCALLLRKTPLEVHEAILRASHQVVPVEVRNECHGGATSAVRLSSARSDRGSCLDSACGSVLDEDCQ